MKSLAENIDTALYRDELFDLHPNRSINSIVNSNNTVKILMIPFPIYKEMARTLNNMRRLVTGPDLWLLN